MNPVEYLKPNIVYFLATQDRKRFWSNVTRKENYGTFSHHEIADFYVCEHVYVLDDSQDGIPIALPLKLAEPEDLKMSNYGVIDLRENLQYYIKESSEDILGPYTLTSKTDLSLIKHQLENKKLYIVSERKTINKI